MSYNTVKYMIDNGLATVSVSRTDVLNALNGDVLNDLLAAAEEAKRDDNVKALILTGEGRAFVAGADIAAMKEFNTVEALEFCSLGHSVMNAFENMNKPVLAAVNGFALGGGMELCLACDFIYASKKAKFGQPELNLGIMPGFGGSQRLAYIVGINKARELIYTCDMIDADEARRIGLVAEVYEPDELMDKVAEKARLIMSKGPCAVANVKRVMNKGRGVSINAALELEIQAFFGLSGTDDKNEGMTAFLEKRKPDFKAR